MKLTEILTKAQILSGLGVFEGNAVDQNLLATSLAIFHDTLNDINNDPKITLWQETWNYQIDNDTEETPAQPSNPPGSGQWLNPFPEENATDPNEPEISDDDWNKVHKFPRGTVLPFPIQRSYPLPNDCRRVIKALSESVELRKTDFAEIVKGRDTHYTQNMFAVNNSKIELIMPQRCTIVYAKEFPDFMPQDDVTLSKLALSYVINLVAYNLALTFNRNSVDRCLTMAQKSYNLLVSNLEVNQGEKYVNQFLTHARFDDFAGGSYW